MMKPKTFSANCVCVLLFLMTLPLAAQLDVWRTDFSIQLNPGGFVRDFDLRTPAVALDVIVGLNIFPKQQLTQVYVYEAHPNGTVANYVRLKSNVKRNVEGRSLVRNWRRNGYVIAMIEYKAGAMDTLLSLINIDTAGVIRWQKIIDIQDGQGNSYPVVVPTKIIAYRDSIYLVCGYARQGDRQDVFLLQITEAGQVVWIQLYRDVATADHLESPLWCWDMEKTSTGEVVLVGSRVTRFTVSLPPAGCVNERQQGWLLLVDGNTGNVLGNIVYVDAKLQCTEFRKVQIAEEPASGQVWVFAVGWGTRDAGGSAGSVYPQVYAGEIGNLVGGRVWFQQDGAGGLPSERDRYEDLEYWIVADTIYEELGLVGWGYRGYWGYDRSRYEIGRFDRSQKAVYASTLGVVYQDNGVLQRLRHMERSRQDSALYLLGWRDDLRAVLWKAEGRLSRLRGEVDPGCYEPYAGVPLEPADMLGEQVRVEPALYQEVNTQMIEPQNIVLPNSDCSATLP